MIQIQCPICSTIIEVSASKQQVFCPKCIKDGKRIVMLETPETQYKNMGDGLFTKE
jgi:hypothetical protein